MYAMKNPALKLPRASEFLGILFWQGALFPRLLRYIANSAFRPPYGAASVRAYPPHVACRHMTRRHYASRNVDQERFAFLPFAGEAFLNTIPQSGMVPARSLFF